MPMYCLLQKRKNPDSGNLAILESECTQSENLEKIATKTVQEKRKKNEPLVIEYNLRRSVGKKMSEDFVYEKPIVLRKQVLN